MARTVQRSRTTTKRLNNSAPTSSRISNGSQRSNRGRSRGETAGKGRRAVQDARANIGQQRQSSNRGVGSRSGGSSVRGRLGGRITDARQLLNSRGGARSGGGTRPAPSRAARAFRPAAAAVAAAEVVNSLNLNTTSERSMFSQAVRAAMAPVLAPLLSGRGAAATSLTTSSRPAGGSNGPCSLRVANLAQGVSLNDLNDLFSGFAGFAGATFESGGIAVVSFTQRDSASVALEEYNNRELDGRTMVIQLDANSSNVTPGAASRLGPKPSFG